MSLLAPTLVTLARAVVVATLALVPVLVAGPGLRAVPRWMARGLFWSAFIVLLTPAMLTGFVFLPAGQNGAQGSFARESFYVLMLLARFAPLALLVAWLAPPPVSTEAAHVRALAVRDSWLAQRRWIIRAWAPGLRLVFGIVFLLVFQEFELATCWNERSWTVAIFDAQVGGLPLSETLKLAALPLLVQCALLAALVPAARGMMLTPATHAPTRAPGFFLWMIVASTMIAALPFVKLAVPPLITHYVTQRLTGYDTLEILRGPALWREIANGALLSLVATLLAWLTAGWVKKRARIAWAFAVPGLLGALVTGLLVLTLVQLPLFSLLRDTPLPIVIALALVLLPFALLLRGIATALADAIPAHTARAAGSRRAAWAYGGAQSLRALLLLFCFGYGDFTLNALLAPPQLASASARILNLMHYGQSTALSLLVFAAFAVPLAAALLTTALARLYARRHAR